MDTTLSFKMKLFLGLVVLLFILLIFVVMELIFRHYFPQLKYQQHLPYDVKKNIGYTGGYPYSYNKWKMREIDFDADNLHNQFRILCLGDSITFGYGLPYDRVWPKMLQTKLSSKYKNQSIFCINAGGISESTHDQVAFYHDTGWKFGSKIVIVGFCLNDIEPKDYERERLVSEGYKLTLWMESRFALRISYCFTALDLMLTDCYRKYIWPFFTGKNAFYIKEYELNCFGITPNSTNAWHDTLEALNNLKILCSEHNAIPIVAAFPYQFQISNDPRDNAYNINKKELKIDPFEKLALFCKEHNIMFINLKNKFVEKRIAMLRREMKWDNLFIDYVHPNESGQELAASAIAKCCENIIKEHNFVQDIVKR